MSTSTTARAAHTSVDSSNASDTAPQEWLSKISNAEPHEQRPAHRSVIYGLADPFDAIDKPAEPALPF